MSIEEMLESDDYEIFELGLKLKEERDGAISMAERVKYYAKRDQKRWNKYFFEYEMKLMWGDYKNNKKHESK